MSNNIIPSFRAIRDALANAPAPPVGFPLQALRDPAERAALHAAPHLQLLLNDLRAEAQQAITTPISVLSFDLFKRFGETGDRKAFEQAYFDRRKRLLGLALSAVLDESDAYLPALHDLLWEICNEYSWALPAHLPLSAAAAQSERLPPEQIVDLFAAHTAHALAETLALLGERLDPWLHYRVRHEVERRIFQPLFHDPRHFWWEGDPMNWAAVCAGCSGMAALILVEDRERLIGMIERVVRALESFLEGFGADGGCPEGIGYWVYGFGFYTYFAAMLSDYTNGQLDLMAHEKIRQIAAFPQSVSLGNGFAINYSDADPKALIPAGLGSYLAGRFQRSIADLSEPRLTDDHVFRWGHVTRDLLWSAQDALHQPIDSGRSYLPNLAWVVDRQLIDGQCLAFSAKGGHNDEPHNHNDLGHFVLHIGGESLLADLGAGLYTRQYFSAERYENLHTSSRGHSLPVINEQYQQTGREHAATVLEYQDEGANLHFKLDLTKAYAEAELQRFERDFSWSLNTADRSATLKLIDSFQFSETPSGLSECFISLHEPQLAEGQVIWQGQHGNVTLRYEKSAFAARIETEETQPHQHEPYTVYRLLLDTLQPTTTTQADFHFMLELAH